MPQSVKLLDFIKQIQDAKNCVDALNPYKSALQEAICIIGEQDGQMKDLKAKLTLTEFALTEASKITQVTTASTDGPILRGIEDNQYESPHIERMDEQGNIYKYYYEQ